jgi:hypothetical protein
VCEPIDNYEDHFFWDELMDRLATRDEIIKRLATKKLHFELVTEFLITNNKLYR